MAHFKLNKIYHIEDVFYSCVTICDLFYLSFLWHIVIYRACQTCKARVFSSDLYDHDVEP